MGARIVHLIRHGQYVAEPEQRLTDLGRAQAEVMAARLASLPITRIRNSTAPRAVQTADGLARRFPAVPRQANAKLLELIPSRPRTAARLLPPLADADYQRDAARLPMIDAR